MAELAFTLPFCLESLNVRDRKHWSKRAKDKQNLNQEVMVAIGGPRHFPRPAWRHVEVHVVRCSAGRLDTDNLYASFKSLGDVLKELGIIEDDRAGWLSLDMKQDNAPVGEGHTIVRIVHLDEPPKSVHPKKRRTWSKDEPRFTASRSVVRRAGKVGVRI